MSLQAFKLAEHIVYAVRHHSKGGTYDSDANYVEKNSGYFVSVFFNERKDSLESYFEGGGVAATYFLYRWIDARYEFVEKPIYWGFWVENNSVFIDTTTHVETLEEAIELATAWNQLAFYDCANKCIIYNDGSQHG